MTARCFACFSGVLLVIWVVGSPVHAQTLAEALNATNQTWTTSGNAGWFGQTVISHDGTAAVQSGAVSSGQSSTLQTTVSGPGTLTFWWKMAAPGQGAHLTLTDNGVTLLSSFAPVDWKRQTNYLGMGDHILSWVWTTSTSSTNAAWVDEFNYSAGSTAPVITSQPVSKYQAPGLGASFSVGCVGTPPLSYQWRFKDANIPGATGSSLSFSNVLRDSFGDYSVTVTNIAGMVVSTNATLLRSHVAAWGNNYGGYGQSIVLPGLTNALQVAAGLSHSLVLKSDRTVACWGGNYDGQVNVPAGLSNVVSIAAGSYTSLALREDGTVAAWGNLPAMPAEVSNVVAIAGGCGHAVALRADGTVVGWGDPAVPAGLTNIVGVAAGCNHALAVNAQGAVFAWGANDYGKATVPPGLSNVVAVAAGDYHSVALKADGTVYAWGGYWDTGPTNVPPGLSNVVAIASGNSHVIALKADGTIVMWGAVPSAAAYLTDVTAIAGGDGFTLALVGDQPPVRQGAFSESVASPDGFRVRINSQSGRVFQLEYLDTLLGQNWTALPLAAGNGGTLRLGDPTATNAPARYYRVRAW